jgi:hypothetical protein
MNIETLVTDIYSTVRRKDGWFTTEVADELAKGITDRLTTHFSTERIPRLRLSGMGPRCNKALWHSFHTPELAEPLQPWAEIKFSYGYILEALALALAKAAGHEVVGEQDEVVVDGVAGHRDAVVDGCVVDVKSCTSLGMEDFRSGAIRKNDDFGYLSQLDGYLVGSLDDPLVRRKDRAYLLAIDKTLGHMYLYEHRIREAHIKDRIRSVKWIVGLPEPPECTCKTKPHLASGNIQLAYPSNYSEYKYCCFPHLRTFIYSNGPVYLTHVARKPDVKEVDKYGNVVYNNGP